MHWLSKTININAEQEKKYDASSHSTLLYTIDLDI